MIEELTRTTTTEPIMHNILNLIETDYLLQKIDLEILINYSENVPQKRNDTIRKSNHALKERIVKEFCQNTSLDDVMSKDLNPEFTLIFRLLQVNIMHNFEVEIQLISLKNDEQTIECLAVSHKEFLEYPKKNDSSYKNAFDL